MVTFIVAPSFFRANPWREVELASLPTRFGENIETVITALGDLQKIVNDAQAIAQIGTEK
ncbi:MAG: hypothetical protein KJ702_12015 [Gammaproteobacteria bacterium]|nr:hypothetical protein [Gammaproteobacteria bacterium]